MNTKTVVLTRTTITAQAVAHLRAEIIRGRLVAGVALAEAPVAKEILA